MRSVVAQRGLQLLERFAVRHGGVEEVSLSRVPRMRRVECDVVCAVRAVRAQMQQVERKQRLLQLSERMLRAPTTYWTSPVTRLARRSRRERD